MILSRAPRTRARLRRVLALGALALLVASCTETTGPAPPSETSAIVTTAAETTIHDDGYAALQLLLDGAEPLRRFSLGTDLFGVWICHVPVGVKDRLYNPVDFRLDLDLDAVVGLLNDHVTPYFDAISDHRYRTVFAAGGEVSISADQTDDDCVDKAGELAGDDITGVLVIADAEHAEDQHGGWGDPGDPCTPSPDRSSCSARTTGRAIYIGASDFHPDWGAVPAVDLLEHEIGHSLGFPHSGPGDGYTSGIDVMSNSAAPRDVNDGRRNGPNTIAVNRVAAGWIPPSDVLVFNTAGTYRLVPSTAPRGARLLVLPLDDQRFLTVEVLDATGYNDFLPHSGVVVHEIDQSPTACRDQSGKTCLNEYRVQFPVSGVAPYTELLQPGNTWSGLGWSVTAIVWTDTGWEITVSRTD